MKAEHLIVGANVVLTDGSTATVLELDPAHHTLLVRYLDCPFEPGKEGSETHCSEDDVIGNFEGDEPSHMAGTLEGERPANVPNRPAARD